MAGEARLCPNCGAMSAYQDTRPTPDLGEDRELKPLDDILRDWENGSMDAAGTIEDLVHLLESLHAELEKGENG